MKKMVPVIVNLLIIATLLLLHTPHVSATGQPNGGNNQGRLSNMCRKLCLDSMGGYLCPRCGPVVHMFGKRSVYKVQDLRSIVNQKYQRNVYNGHKRSYAKI